MISRRELKEYGFDDISLFFNYVVESKINGQHTQCVTLIKEMSKPQKKDFIDYLEISEYDNEAIEKLKYDTLKLI